VQKFAGFLALYSEGKDTDEEDEGGALPQLAEGEGLDLAKPLEREQKFTQPRPRFTEATLVRALEENGIGRPSTYAPIITTIQQRGYVKKDGGALKPQPLGIMVSDLLKDCFANIINPQFTAKMEEGLDEIARGEMEWAPFLKEFHDPFEVALQEAMASVPKMDEPADEACERCGKPMVIKKGRFGLFLACSGFPDCRNTKPHLLKTGVPCPKDQGDLVEKKSRKGKTFYACANYPKCEFATNLRPIPEPCPECKGLLTAFPRGGVRCTQCEFKGRRPPRRVEEDQDAEAIAAGG
ncbi:MAG: DNA topoisomerase, partial [Dehalococcoidia bacterium]